MAFNKMKTGCLTQNSKLITQDSKLKAQTGFTLVEVLVSLVIISITATGIFASFIAAQHYVQRSKRRIIAFNFARQQFERLKPSVREDTWANTPQCDPDLNGMALTSTLNCPSYSPAEPVWTDWKNLPGDFGNSATWNGRRRYKVEASGSGDYRAVTAEIRWRAVD